jgi:hypothetical protein
MTWRRATVILVGLLVGLSTWMYLRDRGPYTLRMSPRVSAERDAEHLLALLMPSRACSGSCGVRALGRSGAGQWRVQVRAHAWRRCFVITLSQFGYSEQSGVTGLRSIGCGRAGDPRDLRS